MIAVFAKFYVTEVAVRLLAVCLLNTRELLAAEIESLQISEIKSYLEEVKTNLNRKRLLVYSRGKFNSAPSAGRRLSDSMIFK